MTQKTLATVTAKGQITIPAGHRKAWGLQPGDKIAFGRRGEKSAAIEPKRKRSIFALLDELPPLDLGRPLRQEDIEQAIEEEMTEQEARSKSGRVIGLDTNVLLRLSDKADPQQARLAASCSNWGRVARSSMKSCWRNMLGP